VTPPPASAPVVDREPTDLLPAEATWQPVNEPVTGAGGRAPRTPPVAPAPARRGVWARARTVLFWLHLVTGVAAGAVILAMSATGVVLAYQRQMTEWVLGRQLAAAPAAAARLPLDTLLARAVAAAPAGMRATAVTLRAESRTPVAVAFEARGVTGRRGRRRAGRVGAGRRWAAGAPHRVGRPGHGHGAARQPGLQALFGGAERLHRSLMIGRGTRSPVGTAVTGASNLAFFFLLLSGLYLWVPRRWTRRAVRAVALPARGVRGRARDWNWHHVMGLWAAPGLAVVVGSAAFLSYTWPERLVARAAGVPPRAEGERAGGARARAPRAPAASRPARASLDTLAARATSVAAAGGWYSVQLRLPAPDAPKFEVAATVSTARALRPDRRATVTLDAGSAGGRQAPGLRRPRRGPPGTGLGALPPHRRGVRRRRADDRDARVAGRRGARVDGARARAAPPTPGVRRPHGRRGLIAARRWRRAHLDAPQRVGPRAHPAARGASENRRPRHARGRRTVESTSRAAAAASAVTLSQ
jgi:uncharacterized iron-regulated membrane protein